MSERTPYPTGNFKMAVRHGGEGNARDVLARRKLLLSSVALGKKEAEAAEAEASAVGDPHNSTPIRLPAVDEMRRHAPTATAGSGVLEPARALIGASGEIREFGPLPPPGPAPHGRPLPSEGSPGRKFARKTPCSPDVSTTPRLPAL